MLLVCSRYCCLEIYRFEIATPNVGGLLRLKDIPMVIDDFNSSGFGDQSSGPISSTPVIKRETNPAHRPIQNPVSPVNSDMPAQAALLAKTPDQPLSHDPVERKWQIMREAQKHFPNDSVAADLTVTQALHESHPHRPAMSRVAREKNNLFGIRHKGRYAAFPTWQDSVEAYAHTITNNFPDVLGQKDFETASWGLMHGVGGRSYAQDKLYLSKLIRTYRSQVEPMHHSISPASPSLSVDYKTSNTLQKGRYHVLKGARHPIQGTEQLVKNAWGKDFPVRRMPRIKPSQADTHPRPGKPPRKIHHPDI